MMKWVFLLTLLVFGGVSGLLGMNLVIRWNSNMFETQRVGPQERVFAMPPGSVPRQGGEVVIPKEERDLAAARRNPVTATPESVRLGGELYAVYCTACHGGSGKGDDGYWQSYLSVGGAVMPSYGEALTAEERWHVVNFLRTLAQR
jgi:mono/diheme cytochrome c family protein